MGDTGVVSAPSDSRDGHEERWVGMDGVCAHPVHALAGPALAGQSKVEYTLHCLRLAEGTTTATVAERVLRLSAELDGVLIRPAQRKRTTTIGGYHVQL